MDLIGPLRRKASRLSPHTWGPTSLPSLPCKHTFELVSTCTDWNFEMRMKWKWISFLVSDKSASVMWVFLSSLTLKFKMWCPFAIPGICLQEFWVYHSAENNQHCFGLYLSDSFHSHSVTLCLFLTSLPVSSPFLFSTSLPPSPVGWACREPGWLGWWIICSTSLPHSLRFSLCLAHCLIMLSFTRYFLSLFLFRHRWTGEQTSKQTPLLDIFTFEKRKKEAQGKIIWLPLGTSLHLSVLKCFLISTYCCFTQSTWLFEKKWNQTDKSAENCNTTLRRRLLFTPLYMLDMAKNVWDEKTKHQKALALKKFSSFVPHRCAAYIL